MFSHVFLKSSLGNQSCWRNDSISKTLCRSVNLFYTCQPFLLYLKTVAGSTQACTTINKSFVLFIIKLRLNAPHRINRRTLYRISSVSRCHSVAYPRPKIYNQDTNTWNVHRESRNTRNWFRYEIFYYLSEFKVFRHEETETQFLIMLSFPSAPQRAAPLPQTTGLASASSENRLACSEFKSQLTAFFFQIPQILSSSRLDVIHIPGPISYLRFLLWHLWLSHPPCACVNTCAQCVHQTNPCPNRKVLNLTKQKYIYKTKNDNIKKSLRNYITIGVKNL